MSQTPQDLGTLAFHWIVQRPDGAGFGTTSHDRKQQLRATCLEPRMDLQPDELMLTEEMFGSSLDIKGGLSSTAMTLSDLRTARWSGAAVQLLSGDWSTSADPTVLSEGTLGAINADGDALSTTIDLAPIAAHLPPCIHTSPECRAELGDRQCGIDMRSRRRRVSVEGADEEWIELAAGDYSAFRMGRLRWTSGSHCGLEQPIVEVDGRRLRLLGSHTTKVSSGDRALLSEGCDGRRATCSERFGNILNFRGEPDLPGSGILMRFPGG